MGEAETGIAACEGAEVLVGTGVEVPAGAKVAVSAGAGIGVLLGSITGTEVTAGMASGTGLKLQARTTASELMSAKHLRKAAILY
jgi:hypothetical protein